MLWLLYYGRLEKEKGFDSLVEAVKILQEKKIAFELFVFGKGSLESELLPLVWKNVHFFGFQPLSRIRQYVENIDYCLMPSEFLETFGLSALNALSRGLPVVGYKKWGLEPFIFPDCNLFVYKGQNTISRLVHCIEKLSQLSDQELKEKKSVYQTSISKLLKHYTKEERYQRFLKLCWDKKPQKIILVSDFINKVWGIETYLHDVKDILESHGHEVKLWWWYLPKWWRGKLRIYLGLLFAPMNVWDTWRFKRFLKEEKPDLIFFNSLLRNLGRRVVKEGIKYKNKLDSSLCSEWQQVNIRMMYHDFGYFFPFPHKLFHLEDCKTPLILSNFMFSVKNAGIITKLAVLCKYVWMKKLVRVLKKSVDLHLVPSEFMVNIVSKSYWVSQKKVKAFNHFIQE